MSLADDYKNQFDWRAWSSILDALPALRGQTVLDLGCGVGDQAAELVARGARVIGVDMNETLLQEARSLRLPAAEFRTADLRSSPEIVSGVDGLWSSFTASYFPDLPAALAEWSGYLKPGGWIALTEIDDLFGHGPLSAPTKSLLDGFNQDAPVHGYDLYMGRKLRGYLEQSGFRILKTLTLPDQELSFDGPARPEVVEAWRARFERMKLLRDFCGAEFEQVRDEFLDCLTMADHRSVAKVCCCIAIKPAGA